MDTETETLIEIDIDNIHIKYIKITDMYIYITCRQKYIGMQSQRSHVEETSV